jgi:hypothetical protein
MKMTESCGQSYGLHQVAYDILEEVGLGTDYWWSRMNPAFPHLCVAPWGANAVRNTWGPCVGDEPREACQVWAINQSLETLSRQMFRATALMNPHFCGFAEK